MPNQQAKTVAKALVDNGFTLTEYQQEYIVTKVNVLTKNQWAIV